MPLVFEIKQHVFEPSQDQWIIVHKQYASYGVHTLVIGNFGCELKPATLPFEVHRLLQHLIGRCDGPAGGLERTLADDHLGEFGG